MSFDEEWPDVWSEYRRVFEALNLDEARARAAMDQTDPDRSADALKEFIVRCQERGVPDDGLIAELMVAVAKLRGDGPGVQRAARAARLFGCASEDLGGTRTLHLAERVVRAGRP